MDHPVPMDQPSRGPESSTGPACSNRQVSASVPVRYEGLLTLMGATPAAGAREPRDDSVVLLVAVELGGAGGHLDAAEDVAEQQRLGPVHALVAQRGVERAAAVVGVAPGDRVVAHRRRSARDAVA